MHAKHQSSCFLSIYLMLAFELIDSTLMTIWAVITKKGHSSGGYSRQIAFDKDMQLITSCECSTSIYITYKKK
jgi:hypothetical protein